MVPHCPGRVGALVATALVVSVAAGLPPSPSTAQPAATKLVRLPFPKYDGTLTPYTFEVGYPLVTLVYDTLLWRDAEGVPRPWLARSVKRSDGGRRVTVRLRKGVRWHDGRPLTAADVAFTFRYVARRFHPRFSPQLARVESVRATNRLTVSFGLSRPSLAFDDQPLADLPILPRHLWKGVPPARLAPRGLPVGSGPYRLTGARPGVGYRFRANRTYFKGRPSVERIQVPIIRQEELTHRALQRRQVDMLPVGLGEDAAEELGGSLGINVLRGPSYSGTALLLNLRRPPFERRAVRRAVALALDLDRIVQNAGPGEPADEGFIHPQSQWASGEVLQRFDLAAARRDLAQLKVPRIRVLAPANDAVRAEAGRQVVLALRRAGAKATLTERSRGRLGRAIGEDGSKPDFEAAIVATPPLASYDPDFLRRVFGAERGDAPLNYSGYRSEAFGALAERVATARDRRARSRAVVAELRLLARDLPEIPLFFSEGAFAYRPNAHDGWVFIAGTGILDKRSFLPGEASSPPRRVEGSEEQGAAEEPEEAGSPTVDVLRIASLAVLAIVLVLVALALVSRRRARES